MKAWQQIRENPVFVKEMRVGFREKKVFYSLTVWVIIIALFASISSVTALTENNAIEKLPESGRFIFEMLFWVQLVLLSMLSPSLTTSSVSGERERQSLEMLLTTHLAPSEVIFGKFGFAASFIALALFSTVPLEAIVFFLGGVSLASFLAAKLILLSIGLLSALLGLMLSARETRSAYATGQTYLCILLLGMFVLPLISAMRYATDVPTKAYVICGLLIVYLLLFFFWKSVHHLEERAFHLKVILTVGLLFYIVLLAIMLSEETLWGEIRDSIWIFYAPLNYFLFGLMLNPQRPERLHERQLFAQSPLSRPFYWVLLLVTGTLLPNIYSSEFNFIALSFYTVLAGLGTALISRALASRQPSRFPVVYGVLCLLLNVIPIFFAIIEPATGDKSMHPSTLSPIVYLVTSYDSISHTTPVLAYTFYSILVVVGLVLSWRRQKPAVEPTTGDP